MCSCSCVVKDAGDDLASVVTEHSDEDQVTGTMIREVDNNNSEDKADTADDHLTQLI